ncbi:hypothetical protein AB837_00577 [bacterium AB1]|nr:hypothetical protein AB837_00577 [bacterium AB1]
MILLEEYKNTIIELVNKMRPKESLLSREETNLCNSKIEKLQNTLHNFIQDQEQDQEQEQENINALKEQCLLDSIIQIKENSKCESVSWFNEMTEMQNNQYYFFNYTLICDLLSSHLTSISTSIISSYQYESTKHAELLEKEKTFAQKCQSALQEKIFEIESLKSLQQNNIQKLMNRIQHLEYCLSQQSSMMQYNSHHQFIHVQHYQQQSSHFDQLSKSLSVENKELKDQIKEKDDIIDTLRQKLNQYSTSPKEYEEKLRDIKKSVKDDDERLKDIKKRIKKDDEKHAKIFDQIMQLSKK